MLGDMQLGPGGPTGQCHGVVCSAKGLAATREGSSQTAPPDKLTNTQERSSVLRESDIGNDRDVGWSVNSFV